MRILMMRTTAVLLFLCSGFPWAGAQAGPRPPSEGPTVTLPSTGFAGLDQYRASRIAVYTNDYGQLARYRDANAALKRERMILPEIPGRSRTKTLSPILAISRNSLAHTTFS
jgi:hypothetical protein